MIIIYCIILNSFIRYTINRFKIYNKSMKMELAWIFENEKRILFSLQLLFIKSPIAIRLLFLILYSIVISSIAIRLLFLLLLFDCYFFYFIATYFLLIRFHFAVQLLLISFLLLFIQFSSAIHFIFIAIHSIF